MLPPGLARRNHNIPPWGICQALGAKGSILPGTALPATASFAVAVGTIYSGLVSRKVYGLRRGVAYELWVPHPQGRSPYRGRACPRGLGGGLGRRFLLGRHLLWGGMGNLRPVGRDGGDGHAHREGSHRSRADAAGASPSLEARPGDDDAGSPLGRTTRVVGWPGSSRRPAALRRSRSPRIARSARNSWTKAWRS